MQENLYQAPEAELMAEEQSEALEFYVVSISKLIILFLSTMGFYALYWFYKNWSNYKRYHDETLWPIPRALFTLFFVHSLFSNVNSKIEFSNREYSWQPGLLATIYVLLLIGSMVTQRMSENGYGYPLVEILTLLAMPLQLWVLVRAQKAINWSENDVKGDSNSALTPANFLWIVLGLAFWALSLFGLFAVVS